MEHHVTCSTFSCDGGICDSDSTSARNKRSPTVAIKHTTHKWPTPVRTTTAAPSRSRVTLTSDKLVSPIFNNLPVASPVFIITFTVLMLITSVASASTNTSTSASTSASTNAKSANFNSASLAKHNTTTTTTSSSSSNIVQQLVLYSLKKNASLSNVSSSSHHHGHQQRAPTIIQNESYKLNTRNLERVSRMIHESRMKSACVEAGLWAIFYNQNFQNIAAILYASSNSADQTCTQNQINETDYSQYKSIRHVGHSSLLSPALSLYKGPFFSLEELYFDGTLLSLPSPELFQSYGFTGNDSWTLYEHTNFTGHAICLMASGGSMEDAVTNTFDRVIYNKNKGVEFMIGAVQKGCTDKHNRTVIYPSGETVVQWTNKPIGSDHRLENVEFRIHNNELPSLKLISEFDDNILTTDAEELRLPQKYTFNRFILNTGVNGNGDGSGNKTGVDAIPISWTVFSGTEFTGKSKCFHANANAPSENSKPSSSNGTSTEAEAENDIFDFRTPFRKELFLVGSIKKGCFESNETEELPSLELHLSDEDEPLEHHSFFFISFIIGLILLVIVILLSIAMISYYYIVTRRRQRRAEREARAMRS